MSRSPYPVAAGLGIMDARKAVFKARCLMCLLKTASALVTHVDMDLNVRQTINPPGVLRN